MSAFSLCLSVSRTLSLPLPPFLLFVVLSLAWVQSVFCISPHVHVSLSLSLCCALLSQARATVAIANCVEDNEQNKLAVLKAGGLNAVVGLLWSPNEEV